MTGRTRHQGPREPNGRAQRNPSTHGQQELEAMDTVLRKRCQLMGFLASEANMRIVKAEWFGCNAGRWLVMTYQDKPELWDAIKYARTTTITYLKTIGAPMPWAKTMNFDMLADRIDAGPAGGHTPDPTLTMEERTKRATDNYMRLLMWLGVSREAASEVRRVVVEDGEIHDAQALSEGLHAVARGMKG